MKQPYVVMIFVLIPAKEYIFLWIIPHGSIYDAPARE